MSAFPMITKKGPGSFSLTVKLPVNAMSRAHVDAEIEKIRDAVIPICGEDKTMRPRLLGSGVLVQFGGHLVLVTAMHVLTDNEDIPLFTFGPDGVARSLRGNFITSEADDLALRVLSPADAAVLSHRPFIPESMIVSAGMGGERFYASVVGYPASASKRPERGFIDTPMEVYSNFATELIGGRISVNFDIEDGAFSRQHGAGRARKPTGKSGGAIFGFPAHTHMVAPWDRPKLVGISTRWKRNEHRIEGTGMGALMKMLKAAVVASTS